MKIFFLDCHITSVTGGHKYNDAFKTYLEIVSRQELVNLPNCAKTYHSWKRIFAPFVEIKRLFLFRKNDVAFFCDTSYKYLFLLAFLLKLLCRTYKVSIIHHFAMVEEKNILYKFLQKIYLSTMDAFIVPSPYTKDVASLLFPNKKVFYIPLPFKRKFDPSEEFNIGNFLYVGTVDERKGLLYLIEALGMISDEFPNRIFKLEVVGKITDELYYDKLLNAISRYHIEDKISFLGRVSNDKLKECYKKAELFIFPSLLEGYGIVLVEAMYYGLPIIAFNNSAIPYTIVDGFNGLLAMNKNPESLKDKIMLLFGNLTLRSHLQAGIEFTISQLKTEDDFKKAINDFWNYILNK